MPSLRLKLTPEHIHKTQGSGTPEWEPPILRSLGCPYGALGLSSKTFTIKIQMFIYEWECLRSSLEPKLANMYHLKGQIQYTV